MSVRLGVSGMDLYHAPESLFDAYFEIYEAALDRDRDVAYENRKQNLLTRARALKGA